MASVWNSKVVSKTQLVDILRRTPYLKQVFLKNDQLNAEREALNLQNANLIREKKQLEAERDEISVERDQLRTELYRLQYGWPPGHFYSPIPNFEEIKSKETVIFDAFPRILPGINLNEDGQINLFQKIKRVYSEQPFTDFKQENLRYFFINDNYSYGEAIILYCLIRYLQPKKIIEIGSGYSSCAILDTNELFFDNSICCTFIEPYPKLLQSLLNEDDILQTDEIWTSSKD